MEGKMSLVKYLMFFFNFLFWLSGLLLIVVGAIVKDKYGDILKYADHKFADAAVFIIVVGVIVCIIGFLGCFGAINENYCMVMTFAVLLSVVFVCEIIACILGFVYKAKVKAVATKALGKAVKQYGTNAGEKKLLDWSQKHLKCCGEKGPTDFDSLKKNGTCGKGKGVASCHVGGKCSGKLHSVGCQAGFIAYIKSKLALIAVLSFVLALIQVLGIVAACSLGRSIKGEYENMEG